MFWRLEITVQAARNSQMPDPLSLPLARQDLVDRLDAEPLKPATLAERIEEPRDKHRKVLDRTLL